MTRTVSKVRSWVDDRIIRPVAMDALLRRTDNFGDTRWLGVPIWQNVTDAWLLQEAIVSDGVDLVIECGTNRGGSSYYFGSLFDLLGRGSVITVDIQNIREVDHPRVEYLIGSSVDPAVLQLIRERVQALEPAHVLVVLDSDHSQSHVAKELSAYADFVAVGGYMCVQDGCIDEIRRLRNDRPGPLPAIEAFLATDKRFEVDEARTGRYLLTHGPKGWLRRVA